MRFHSDFAIRRDVGRSYDPEQGMKRVRRSCARDPAPRSGSNRRGGNLRSMSIYGICGASTHVVKTPLAPLYEGAEEGMRCPARDEHL